MTGVSAGGNGTGRGREQGMARDQGNRLSVAGFDAPSSRRLPDALGTHSRHPWHASLVGLAALCVLIGALFATSASAQAAVEGERLHETTPSFHFPVKVVEANKKHSPELSGIAVSDATGDVYVVEGDPGTVEQFKPTNNASGEAVAEAPGETLEVPKAVAVAVDNSPSASDPSAGVVYVGTSKGTLVKFTEVAGKLMESKIKGFAASGGLRGLAVDANGNVLVSAANGEITKFNNAVTNAVVSTESTQLGTSTRSDLAVDSNDGLYVGSVGVSNEPLEQKILEYDKREFEELNPEYEGGQRYGVLAKLTRTGEILNPALMPEALGAVAVNDNEGPGEDSAERNDLYVVNLTGAIGEKVSTVSEFAPPTDTKGPGELLQQLTLPPENGDSEGVGVAFDSDTGELFVLDGASHDVDVYKLAPEGQPSVSSLSAQESLGAWTLGAEVNAGGADTHYHFEYGPAFCAPPTSGCISTSSSDLGAAFGPQAVSQALAGLAPGVYYYRVVAENGHGTVASVEKSFTAAATLTGLPDGREWELVSSPVKAGAVPEAPTLEGGLIQASETGNAITYISNGPFAGEHPEGSQSPVPTQQLSIRGSSGWTTTDINTPASVANGSRVGGAKEYRAFSPNLSLALVEPITAAGALAQPSLAPNETLQKSIYLRGDAPLGPEASGSANFAEALKNGGVNHNAGFLALVENANANIFVEGGGSLEFGGASEEGGLEVEGATTDLSHVVFRSVSDDPGLYEWVEHGKPLQRVGVLPDGVSEPEARLGFGVPGAQGALTNNAISSDGSRVIWTSASPKHLYVRDTATERTLQLDSFQTEALEQAEASRKETADVPSANFAAATSDGSRIFFTDTQRLTAASRATANSPDLYVYEVSGLGGELRDLTPQPGADVLVNSFHQGGGVIGISEDGSYVYFMANGELASGASPGHCAHNERRPLGTTCNLYVSHYHAGGWETKLVAALSSHDGPDWGDFPREADLAYQTSHVSPSGQYLAFMSERNLTGYEPLEETTGNRDEEVYLYNAEAGLVDCASCMPNGAPPVGVHDVQPVNNGNSPEGLGLLVDRPQIWAEEVELGSNPTEADHWLAGNIPGWTSLSEKLATYQSRYLTDDGRLFFNSPDDLVPGATGVKEMVYEYQPNGAGSCTTEGGCVGLVSSGDSEHEQAFLDASANGNDVFFLSTEPLAPNPENSLSVYDAHVCEPSSPCTSSAHAVTPSCDEASVACRPAPELFSGGAGKSATEDTSGAGNITAQLGKVSVLPSKTATKPKLLTKAQKLAIALKACRKAKKKSRRLACDKAAHKKYGPPAKKPSEKASRAK